MLIRERLECGNSCHSLQKLKDDSDYRTIIQSLYYRHSNAVYRERLLTTGTYRRSSFTEWPDHVYVQYQDHDHLDYISDQVLESHLF